MSKISAFGLALLLTACSSAPKRDYGSLLGKLRSIHFGEGWKEISPSHDRIIFSIRVQDEKDGIKQGGAAIVTEDSGAEAMQAFGQMEKGMKMRLRSMTVRFTEARSVGDHCKELIPEKQGTGLQPLYFFACLKSDQLMYYAETGGQSPRPEAVQRVREILSEEIAL